MTEQNPLITSENIDRMEALYARQRADKSMDKLQASLEAHIAKLNKKTAVEEPRKQLKNPNESEKLAILNEATIKFWANADPLEKDTQPKKQIVIDWLISQGFSKISAKQGATIIRPEWAAKGNY